MVKTVMWLAGGISAAFGIALMGLGGVGVPGGPIATQVSQTGFDALPELTLFSSGYWALALFVGGILTMAAATSNAYEQTGGY